MTNRTRILLLAVGLLALAASVGVARHDASASASRTWPPFVLVAGLLLIGAVAYEDGTFEAAGALLDRLPGGEGTLYVVAMGLVAGVTVVLNLDTSVAFLTPVLVGAARRRGASEERLLYGCVFLSNAASLLLPGSNLTNLLVLSGTHVRGSAFLRSMALPWGGCSRGHDRRCGRGVPPANGRTASTGGGPRTGQAAQRPQHRLETNLEAKLELALLVAGCAREAVAVARNRGRRGAHLLGASTFAGR